MLTSCSVPMFALFTSLMLFLYLLQAEDVLESIHLKRESL